MKNNKGKLRKYAVVIAFIASFVAMYLTLKDAKEWPIVLVINIFLFTILLIDIIDAFIKMYHGKQTAIVRHAIGLLFIIPAIIALCNRDYDFNLKFLNIILYAYEIYTMIFYLATQEYDILKDKVALLKGFLLDAPPTYIFGTFCLIIAQKAYYKTDSKTHKNIMYFEAGTLKTCERIAFICIIIYSVLLLLFIVLDIIKRNNTKLSDDYCEDLAIEKEIELEEIRKLRRDKLRGSSIFDSMDDYDFENKNPEDD